MYAKGSKKFLVKCFAIEDKLLVDAVDEGGKEPAHIGIEYVIVLLCLCLMVIAIFEFTLNYFVCVVLFRFEKYAAESGVEGDYDAHFKNLGKLVTDLQDQILYKLDEGLKPVASTSQSR